MIVGLTGVTVIDWSVAAVTDSVVLPEIDPRVAIIVIVPVAEVVANPLALMEAAGDVQRYIPQFADHVTCVVIFLLVPSE